MTIIKSYSDLQQSKKLAKILPITSIDFAWCIFSNGSTRLLPVDDWEVSEYAKSNVEIIPCWSLSALLNVLPKIEYLKPFIDLSPELDSDKVAIYYHSEDSPYIVRDNLIDACYEMILKLHELKIL